MMIRMQKARGLNIPDGKWKKRFNIITSEVAHILTPRTSFPSAHNVNGCQGSFPSSFWCGEGHPTVALAWFELASDRTIQGHWLPLQKLCVLVHSAQTCYCRQQSQPKSTPLNSVQIWSGTAANSARIRIKESIFCCVIFFFLNVLGFFRDEWCFICSLYDGSVSCMFALCMKRLLEGGRYLQYSLKVVRVWICLLISGSLCERQIPPTRVLRSLLSFFVLALCQDKQALLF